MERSRSIATTLLLAEDNEHVRRLLRLVLERNGYTVLEAQSADEVLELARNHQGPIHSLLTNAVLPHMTVLQLEGQIRSLRPDIKVLCISGHAREALDRQGILAPSTAFLQKPFTPDVLLEKVREMLEG